jgi:hypothetical protein
MTLAVLAHERDEAAARLVRAWHAHGARLIVPRDLSRPGWRMYVGGRGEEWFVAGGERCRTADLHGVLNRLPRVAPEDLEHLHGDDRAYSAHEMTAFLTAWLAKLRCRVLNRPSAGSLLGPPMGEAHLAQLRARAGLPAGRGGCAHAPCTVAVVGDETIVDADPAHAERARRLAAAAGAELLTVSFMDRADPDSVTAAQLLVDVDDARVGAALLRCFGLGAAA